MVQPHDLGAIIDEHPFFKGIDSDLRTLLVGCAANERFEPGEFLSREGRPADKFYLIRAGLVAVEVTLPGKRPIVLETVGEDEMMGWSWMVEPFLAAFDARAVTQVRAVSFDGKCLRAKMANDHLLGYEVLKRFVPVISHRLATARMQLLDLYAPHAEAAKTDKAKPDKAKKVKKAKPEKAARGKAVKGNVAKGNAG